jgi:hypothetical protein
MLTLNATTRHGRGSRTVCLGVAALMAAVQIAFPRTVYDGGKALRQNCESGGYVGTDGSVYTAADGGKWQYLRAQDSLATTTAAFGGHYATGDYDGIGGAASPYIRVNMSGASIPVSGGEPIEPDELYIHPGNPTAGNSFAVLRFIVPEDGWYSAFLSAHDVNKQPPDHNVNATSGADVCFLANGKLQAKGVVSLEDYAGGDASPHLTHRFDFQMPVRWMAAGGTLDFVIGPNGGHNSDATGMKAFVVREDAGAFYDSGIAFTNNLGTAYSNPYGTIKNGTWNYMLSSVPSGVDFATWAPTNFSLSSSLLPTQATRASAGNERGFANAATGASPYLLVNETDTQDAAFVAPLELHTHPNPTTGWTTLRFRPPVSGWYSGTVVVRDVSKGTGGANGVRVHLNIADQVVTNAYISAEQFSSTAFLAFEARLLATGEPIDIIVSPCGQISSDATTLSAIFRREAGEVYDASTAFSAQWSSGGTAHPFADVIGDGATWDVGYKANAQTVLFTTMPASLSLSGTELGWCVYAFGTSQANGDLPRIALATNGIASADSAYYLTGSALLGTIPNELWAHPGAPGAPNASPVVRANVPADGVYRVRGHARDLSIGNGGNNDGIRFSIAADGYVAASACVSRDPIRYSGSSAEASIECDRLWLKAGESWDAVVDPVANFNNDGTGLGVCYIKEGEAAPSVVNVDFSDTGAGAFSAYRGRGREGWSDWTRWNTVRPDGTAVARQEYCTEADGATRRNMTLTLARNSSAPIAKGSADVGVGSVLLDNWIVSSDAGDVHTFTIGKLKKSEPYTLWLYSSKDGAGGNATFSVGGKTKGVEETWSLGATAMATRFAVVSDADGTITGTFAAADGTGGAFNGLTLVGGLPDYCAPAFLLIVK